MKASAQTASPVPAAPAPFDLTALFQANGSGPEGFSSEEARQRLEKYSPHALSEKRESALLDAATLVPGDIVRLRLGDIIPADVRLIEGDYLSVDQSALAGESLPVDKKTGDEAYASSVAKQGEMEAMVTATGGNSYFGKTAKLVSAAKPVSHFQKAVLTIGDYLIYVSLGLAAILILTMLARGEPALTLLQFALILVVAAAPWKYVGFVWIYCLIWVLIEDWAKLHVYRHLELGDKHHRQFLERIKESLHSHTA